MTPRRKKPRADKGQPNPNRAKRSRVLGDGEGDYCVYEVVPPGSTEVPAGALLPIPGVPRFTDTVRAMTWIRKDSKDLLAGKQVMVFRAMELLRLNVEMRPVVTIVAKPKKAIEETMDESKGEPAPEGT